MPKNILTEIELFNVGDAVYRVLDDWSKCPTCKANDSTMKWSHSKAIVTSVCVRADSESTDVGYSLDYEPEIESSSHVFATEEEAIKKAEEENKAEFGKKHKKVSEAVVVATIDVLCGECGGSIDDDAIETLHHCSLKDIGKTKKLAAQQMFKDVGCIGDPVKTYAANRMLEDLSDGLEVGAFFIEDFDPAKIKALSILVDKELLRRKALKEAADAKLQGK